MEQKCTLRAWIAIFRKCVCAGPKYSLFDSNFETTFRPNSPRISSLSVKYYSVKIFPSITRSTEQHGSVHRCCTGRDWNQLVLHRYFRYPMKIYGHPRAFGGSSVTSPITSFIGLYRDNTNENLVERRSKPATLKSILLVLVTVSKQPLHVG